MNITDHYIQCFQNTERQFLRHLKLEGKQYMQDVIKPFCNKYQLDFLNISGCESFNRVGDREVPFHSQYRISCLSNDIELRVEGFPNSLYGELEEIRKVLKHEIICTIAFSEHLPDSYECEINP